ncbi:MAG: electron transfer flavoprotein subunit alpha/FixB family protein [Armatimonadetes bacterium]|nr:electron transfer flavoprotein subunit alpha/FixB family protein [Armatimonadota bacterium]
MSRALFVCFDSEESALVTGCAAALGLPFDTLMLSGEGGAGDKSFVAGFEAVPPADGLAEALLSLSGQYGRIAFVSSMRSKDLAGRLAGLLDAAMLTDVIAVESADTFHLPMVAGSIVTTAKVTDGTLVFTFRPSNFAKDLPSTTGSTEKIALTPASRTQRTKAAARSGGRPDLAQAKIIVTGGRPLKDAATFEAVLGGLADKLGAAVGATRAAVDSGIAANELQVGQTGKIVAPDLYIAAGVSGSTQHMAGIKDSKIIVAINTDADAPIFESADFGLVQDLFTALPEIQAAAKGT